MENLDSECKSKIKTYYSEYNILSSLMTEVEYSLSEVTLSQPNTFEPLLRIKANLKYLKYGQNEPDWMDVIDLKSKIFVRNEKMDWFEIGDAELEHSNSVRLGSAIETYLLLRMSPYTLHRIEELRSGNDLWFKIQPVRGMCITHKDSGGTLCEHLNMHNRKEECKYPMSEWIAHLNTTEFNKIELIEIPKITFPKMPLTEHIMKYLSESNRAMNEGRYGDVLQECRKALDSLDNGIQEWASNESFTEDENSRIKQNSGKDVRKEIYLSKLIGDKIKAKRLNNIRGNLHYYLSLDPHQPEYKGMEFNHDDAKFVLHSVTGFINNILKYMERDQNSH